MNRFSQCLAGLTLVVLAVCSALRADSITPSNLTFTIAGSSATVGEGESCVFFTCPTVTQSGPAIVPSLFDPGTGNPSGAVNLSNGGGTFVQTGGLNSAATSAVFNANGNVTGTLDFPIPVAYNFTVTTKQPWAIDGVQNDPAVGWSLNLEVTDSFGNTYFASVDGGTPDGGYDFFTPDVTSTVTSAPGASLSFDCSTSESPGAPPCPSSVSLLPGSTWSSTLSFTLADNADVPGPTELDITDPFALNAVTAPPEGEGALTPEPASLWLCGAGAFVLLGLALRRRAVTAAPPQ